VKYSVNGIKLTGIGGLFILFYLVYYNLSASHISPRLSITPAAPVFHPEETAMPALQPVRETGISNPGYARQNTGDMEIITVDTDNSLVITPPDIPWQTVMIRKGENLSVIFDSMKLSPAVLHQVMSSGTDTALLGKLMPGKKLDFHIEDGELLSLRYEAELTTTLSVSKHDDGYRSAVIKSELDKYIRDVNAIIRDSMFLAGQQAGLSDNLIMRVVAIFGWDIDFALNIRTGDSFRVVFEEQFKGGVKVNEGKILAAEFINRNKTYRAVRYTNTAGETAYYNDEGYSMRKAFLRTPVNFSRISSRFNPQRKHPVLNTIRAHRGVDYAAPAGTPVKATGNGTITFAGRNGGYGNAVTIRHGGIYDTLYAHLSRFAKGIKRGKSVKQGDIIGYVGQTGLASGPHLHYEFRVNGVHRNPLTVTLPKAMQIPEEYMEHFQRQVSPLLARLALPSDTGFASREPADEDQIILAQQESDTGDLTVH
jgi:murein DD-endopeptidase MepM/ murein hydrolase activator NlpD